MKICKNALSSELLQQHASELQELILKDQWQSSALTWDRQLTQNITGHCLYSRVSENLARKLEQELSFLLPVFSELISLHYLWTPLSGINWHYDEKFSFGATLYLNEEWDKNWGGLFLWQDDDYETSQVYKAIVPTYNTLVLNDENQFHSVTTLSTTAPAYRSTLQIWGKVQ